MIRRVSPTCGHGGSQHLVRTGAGVAELLSRARGGVGDGGYRAGPWRRRVPGWAMEYWLVGRWWRIMVRFVRSMTGTGLLSDNPPVVLALEGKFARSALAAPTRWRMDWAEATEDPCAQF